MNSDQTIDSRIEVLSARLAASEAHQAITNLKSAYGSLADARYSRQGPRDSAEIESLAAKLADLFTDDAIWEAGGALGRCQGKVAIRERFLVPTLLYSWHFFVKPRIEVRGLHASGTWDVLAMCTTTEGRAMWMVGVEHDEYECVDGVWLHARMQLDAKLMAPHDSGWA